MDHFFLTIKCSDVANNPFEEVIFEGVVQIRAKVGTLALLLHKLTMQKVFIRLFATKSYNNLRKKAKTDA